MKGESSAKMLFLVNEETLLCLIRSWSSSNLPQVVSGLVDEPSDLRLSQSEPSGLSEHSSTWRPSPSSKVVALVALAWVLASSVVGFPNMRGATRRDRQGIFARSKQVVEE